MAKAIVFEDKVKELAVVWLVVTNVTNKKRGFPFCLSANWGPRKTRYLE